MEKRLWVLPVLGLTVVWSLALHAGTSPTPGEIAAAWNTLSGGAGGKAVYWRDVDGTDDGSGAICVMDLTTGTEVAVRSDLDMGGGNIKRIRQSNSWGPMPCWSPDGTRIYFFNYDNDWGHWVMNADGSNPKRVSATWDDGGYWLCSWYDNSSVIYNDTSTSVVGGEIVRITINASNDPVGRQVLVGFDAYGGSGRSYVTASGDYVAWTDGDANVPSGGGHRSVVYNWKTSEVMEVIARDDDACDICINPDGSGSAVYCHANHFNATAKSYQTGINPSTQIFAWAQVQGEEFHWLRWSQDPNYICYNDDRSLAMADQRAYIRKAPAGTEWMFLGYGIWGPDVWVDQAGPDLEAPQVIADSVVINGTASDAGHTPEVTVDGVPVPLTGGNWTSEQSLSSFPEQFTIEADDATNTTSITLTVDVP